MAAAEPPNQAVANPMAIPRPGLRPQTRTKIVEILAGTANGCLHELGYSPGLLEKVRYLEESLAKLKAENEKLKNFALTVEDLRKKALAYQQENVKMYEDNTKLFGDCELLRQELSALNMLAKKNEETRGMNTTQILGQYALLQLQYEDALKQIQRLKPKNAAPAQSQPQASGPYPVRSQPPPAVVPSQQVRRSSGSQPSHSPQAFAPQAHASGSRIQPHSPQSFTPQAHALGHASGSYVQSHSPQSFAPQAHAPAPQVQSHPTQPYTLQAQGQPQLYHVPSNAPPPQISMKGGPGTIPPLRRQSAPVGWPHSAISPTAASQVAPPPGYGPYSVGAGVAPPLSHRPGSAGVSPGVGVGVVGSSHRPGSSGTSMSAGHRTPTSIAPTSPISELPLNLQNFASPTVPHAPPPHLQMHPQMRQHPHPQAQHPYPVPPRTGSASSAPRTHSQHSQPQSPALPPEPTHQPPITAQIPAFVTPNGHMVRMALPPERRASMNSAPRMQVDIAPPTRPPGQHGLPDADARVSVAPETPVGSVPETHMDVAPETPMDVASETETQMDVVPEMQDASSPPEVHEAVTPPVDASSAFAVAVADALSGVDGDGGVVRSLKAEEEEPTVKMEVDEDAGGDGADEEEEEEDVEVGPDGLRTVRDCVATIFDADRNYICQFCESRHKSDLAEGRPSEPPPEMPNATLEELVTHCEQEHDYVWNILRRSV